ncbi:hypothetical protein CK230_07640 [Mesorhizobium sp. WSM3859]|nr:hypothetical protein CK230_07640 [Mesorhizobium sp. WSM3859]
MSARTMAALLSRAAMLPIVLYVDIASDRFTVDQDDVSLNRHRDPTLCRSMIFSEDRFPLFALTDLRFEIMLQRNPGGARWPH